MRVVVAPNAFKGSLTASQAAAAMALGVRDVFPEADVVEVPVADGGDGTVEALVSAHPAASWRSVEVEGPLGDPVTAAYGRFGAGAWLELASSSGLTLIAASRLNPRKTSTYGFGQLLKAARGPGVVHFIVGVGGSATNDGGAGMAQALGYRLLDSAGHDLPRGGAALARLERIDPSGFEPWSRPMRVLVACDVTNPLTGPQGASAVYGPQKGADEAAVWELDAALAHFAAVIERELGKRVGDVPGAGAAGGAGAGLMAFLDASLVPGAPLIVTTSGFDEKLPGADLVITGEGRVDSQTAYGKAPGEVAKRAKAARIPVLLIAGTRAPGWDVLSDLGVTAVVTLDQEGDNLQQLMGDAGEMLRRATARACRERAWE
ncbi:MAG: glycerate kinase [Candidatus Dormibacteraceae bacterium]